MAIVEKLMEWRLAGETEVVGENPPQRHFVHTLSNFLERIYVLLILKFNHITYLSYFN
jgi:hypothetical protein